jgi:ABC-type Fe3+ transport system substrate-binding protein
MMPGRQVPRSWLLAGLVPALFLAGCGRKGPEPVRLILISPHRDEVREECALAFREWLRERTTTRAAAAAAALRASFKESAAARHAAVAPLLHQFLSDWRPDDVAELSAAYRSWEEARWDAEHSQALLDALERWQAEPHPVELVWQDIGGGTAQISRYVRARFDTQPDGIGIDVLFGGGTEIYLGMAQAGQLQSGRDAPNARELDQLLDPVRIPPKLHGVPLYDPDRRWFGPMVSSFGILSNLEVLRRIGRPVPRHWADLGEPALQGWVAAGDPRLTGSLHMVYEIILQSHGWDDGFALLLRLGANTNRFIRDSGTLTRSVTEGAAATAGNLDANALSAVGRNPGLLRYEIPEGETVVNPDAIAVFKGAPRPQLAWAFVEFTLSDAGQRLFVLQPGQPGGPHRYPLCRLSVVRRLYDEFPEAARSVGSANPFVGGKGFAYHSEVGIRRWDGLNDLFGAVIMDAQPELSAAWRAILRSGRDPEGPLTRELFRPFVSEAELEQYAVGVRERGPRFRTETINRWGEEARERYRRVRRAAEQP